MKEPQLIESKWIQGNENQKSPKRRQDRPIKVITRIRARAPACSACEIPILSTLSKAAETGMLTKVVIKEVSTKWFSRLSEDDRNARYPESRKKITQTIIKFARKNLVMKGEIFPVGGVPLGIWRATQKGLERGLREKDGWRARYSLHDSVIVEEEKR